MNYKELANDVNNPIGLELDKNGSLKMRKHHHPVSIMIAEFEAIKRCVIECNAQNAFEVATAFGISSIAIGMGLKETGGKLVTMDAYIEEKYNSCGGYHPTNYEVNEKDPDGLKCVKYLVKKFGLQNHVYPTVGFSPVDTEKNLETVFDLSKDKIDFAFIDAGHFDEAVRRDLLSIKPFLAPNAYILLHDVHCFNKSFPEFLMEHFGCSYEIIVPFEKGGYNLAILKNLK